jgi:methylmalonyl-CoA mutase cobalamin-binding domain/chain
MKAGLEILLAEIPKDKSLRKGTVVCGTVRGDVHEIGKRIVAALLQANGFDVYDLGADVPSSKFIEEACRVKADIIGLSALMSSTLGAQKDVIDYLKAVGERKKYIVMVGGGPTTQEWADQIGADGYAKTAPEAVKLAIKLVRSKRS